MKKTFGFILTVLGFFGLVYTGYSVLEKGSSLTELLVFGVLGFIFFVCRVTLVKNTNNQSQSD